MSDRPLTTHASLKSEWLWPQWLDDISWRLIAALARNQLLASCVIGLVALVAYLPGQINLPAIDRTEGVVALSSRHILETGDWLAPRWDANVQRTRPPGTFWVQALAAAAHTEPARNEIATYRLPSMLATVAAVLIFFWIARSLIGRTEALMASLMLSVTPIVALHAQLAIAEALVLPATIAAQLALLAIYRIPEAASWRGWLAVFWIAIATSTWFNALALPLLALTTIVTLTLLDRRWDFVLRLQPLIGLPLLALLSLPWLAAVWTIDGGTLYRGMGWTAILDALEGGQSMKFKTAYGVFVLTLALGFVPAAHLLGPALARHWQARRDPNLRFLLVWLLAPVAALELLSNKPPLYTVQSVMPAGALLVAIAIARGGEHSVALRAWPGMFWTTVLLLGLLAPIGFGALLSITETPPSPALLLGFLALATSFMLAAWLSARGHPMAWFTTSMLGTFLLALWFNGQLMPNLHNFWTAPQLRAVSARLASCAPVPIYISGFREPSLALAVRGIANVTAAEPAARALAAGRIGHAVIESRQIDRFQQALATLAPPLQMRTLGCIRTFNLARGCSLKFHVMTTSAATPPTRCSLATAHSCSENHVSISDKLRIRHCGDEPNTGSRM